MEKRKSNQAFIRLNCFVEWQQYRINERFRKKKIFAVVRGAHAFYCSTRYAAWRFCCAYSFAGIWIRVGYCYFGVVSSNFIPYIKHKNCSTGSTVRLLLSEIWKYNADAFIMNETRIFQSVQDTQMPFTFHVALFFQPKPKEYNLILLGCPATCNMNNQSGGDVGIPFTVLSHEKKNAVQIKWKTMFAGPPLFTL